MSGSATEIWHLPLEDLRRIRGDQRLVVGVAIFTDFPSTETGVSIRKILLLQRSASEEAYPLMYEIPGGHCEDEDSTIFAAVARETREETGLIVTKILKEFRGFAYQTSKGETLQLNFVVEVEARVDGPLQVIINPQEHQAIAWLGKGDDREMYPMTEAMKKVVQDALEAVSLV